jgi:hypothetical protein
VPESPAAIPEGALLLHIGPHKTGTTAIQGLLAAARDDMAAHGVTYPGRTSAHHDAARVLIDRPAGWRHDSAPLPDRSVWDDLVRTVHTTPGRVVVSSEFFALADPDQRAKAVADLGRDRLHLVVAARNPGSIALSTWQQVLRDGKTGTLEGWLEERFRRPEPRPATEGFWSWADTATLVDGWSQVVDLDRIRVVVIDETDRALLPTTFEQLLGLPAGLLSARTPDNQNRSLTAPEAELLRRAIALTKPQLTWDEFSLFFRSGYARRMHDARVPPKDEPRPTLPGWAAEQATAEATDSIERLEGSGVTVIGDLEHLHRIPPPGDTVPVEQVSIDLAAEALAGVILAGQRRLRRSAGQADKLAATQRRLRRAERRIAELTGSDGSAALDGVPARELAAALRGRLRARLTRGGRVPPAEP